MENISHSDFEHSITEEDYKPIKDINDSYFGKVTLLRNTRANQTAIKKQINISDLNTYHRLLEDYSFYLSLEHRNLVKVFGITANDHRSNSVNTSSGLAAMKFPEICIYFEQVQNNLEFVLQKKRAPQNPTTQILSDKSNQNQKLAYFEETELFEIMLGLVDALEYLQQNSICHGDLRPGACFISPGPSSTWKLFNRQLLSESNGPYQRAKERNTDVYLTPIAFDSIGKRRDEPIENKYKADIFALGMTLLECATLKRSGQIYDWNNFSINNKILTQRQEEVRQRYSPYFYEMLMHMIQLDEEKRPDSIRLKELVEQRKLDLTAISNLVVEEEENFLKDLILKIDPKQTAFSQNDSTTFQPFSTQKPFGANQQLSKIEKIDPASISIDEMSYRTRASLAADLEHANVQTFRNEDLQSSSRNFLEKRGETNALLSKKIVVETFSGLPSSGVHEYPDTDSGINYSIPEEAKSSEKTAESFQGNVTNQSHNSFKDPPKEFTVDARNLQRVSGLFNSEMTVYEKALSLKHMIKSPIKESHMESVQSVPREEEDKENLHNRIQETLNDAPQTRLQSVPNEKFIEESELEDKIDSFISPSSSGAGSLGIMEKVTLPVFRDRFHLDLENLLADKKSQALVPNKQVQIEKKDEVVSEVENLFLSEKGTPVESSPAMRLETGGEGSKSKSGQETQTAPRHIQSEPDTHNLNETYIKKPSALLVKTMVQEALEKAKRCREAVKKSKEKYATFQNSRNYYLPNFKQNVKTSYYDDQSYYAAKKCVTEADQYDARIDYDALLDKSSPYRQNPRLRNPLRNRHISASNTKAQGKQETMLATPSQSYLHPSSLSKFDLSFNNSPIRSLATEPNFDVSRDASINLSSMFPSHLKQQQQTASIVKDRSKSPNPVSVSAYTPVKQAFTYEDQLAKSKATLTPENTRMVNQFKEFIQSKVHKSGCGERGFSTENLRKYDSPSISTSLVVRDENKIIEDIKRSGIPQNNRITTTSIVEGQKFDFEEQFQRAMEKAKMAQDYATKVRSTIDRTSEYPRSTSSERFGLKNYNY